MNTQDLKSQLKEVLPKTGLVYSERGGLAEILCKPKIMPLKSKVLVQLQKMEQEQIGETDESKEEEMKI